MADDNTNLDTENAEQSETSQLEDTAAIVEEIAAADEAGESDGTADTATEDAFEATDTQKTLAIQLGFDDEYANNMTEAQAEAADQWGRKQSAYQQRKGKPQKPDEETASVESSTDDAVETDGDLTEDDLYTPEGIAKINAAIRDVAKLKASDKQRDKKQQTSEQSQFRVTADKIFDALSPEFFPDFSPGESADIEPGSAAEDKRQEVVSMAKAIQGGSANDIPLKEAIEQALVIVAPTETQNAAQHEADTGRKKRGSQRLSTPSTSSAKTKVRQATREDQAVADVVEQLSPN